MNKLIVKGSGGAGLGDKVWALIVAIMYARLTDRTLIVDWRDTTYGDGTRNYFHDLFQLHAIDHSLTIPTDGVTHPPAWHSRIHKSLDEIVTEDCFIWNRREGRLLYSFDQANLNYTADNLVMWEMDQYKEVESVFLEKFPKFAGKSHEDVQRSIFREHLRINLDLLHAAKEFENVFFDPNEMIGVHVRKTNESDSSRYNPDVAKFIYETNRLLEYRITRKVFLACDNLDVIQQFRDRFGVSRVLVIPKWMPKAGMHLHKNPTCPDLLGNARDAILDAILLGRCNWLITSASSSFSWLGRMLSNAPLKHQITLSPIVPLKVQLRDIIRRTIPTGTLSLVKGLTIQIRDTWRNGYRRSP
jgi:hypothetical protein